MQSMGVSQAEAKIVFILPTPPKGHYAIDAMGHLAQVNTQSIIEQDGNHWRKILTIMAKLCLLEKSGLDKELSDTRSDKKTSAKQVWRDYRDSELLQQHERIEFEVPTVFSPSVWYFICGGEMQKKVNKLEQSCVYLNEKQTIAQYDNKIFCPYLDYRQFPNADIELTRLALANPFF